MSQVWIKCRPRQDKSYVGDQHFDNALPQVHPIAAIRPTELTHICLVHRIPVYPVSRNWTFAVTDNTGRMGSNLMGWMAPASSGVAMRHIVDVHICS